MSTLLLIIGPADALVGIELSAQLVEVVVGLACGVQLAQAREGPFLLGEVMLQPGPLRGGEDGSVIDHAVAALGAGMVGAVGRHGQKILDGNQRKTARVAREVRARIMPASWHRSAE